MIKDKEIIVLLLSESNNRSMRKDQIEAGLMMVKRVLKSKYVKLLLRK